ncbi:MAG: hypothetical protein ACRD0K_08250 [Egibacteraceae bacterium]
MAQAIEHAGPSVTGDVNRLLGEFADAARFIGRAQALILPPSRRRRPPTSGGRRR